MVTEARARWTNWGGTFSCSPTRIESPSTEEEVANIVRTAADRGEHVKVIGSGHSFTDIGCTDGCLIKLDNYNKVLDVDRDGQTITAQAGITILELSDALAISGSRWRTWAMSATRPSAGPSQRRHTARGSGYATSRARS